MSDDLSSGNRLLKMNQRLVKMQWSSVSPSASTSSSTSPTSNLSSHRQRYRQMNQGQGQDQGYVKRAGLPIGWLVD